MIRFGDITIDRKARTVTHRAFSHTWQNGHRGVRFQLIQHLLLSGGITPQELFDRFYADDPEGGPIDGPHMIHVMLAQLRPILDRLELKLHQARHNSETVYWVGS